MIAFSDAESSTFEYSFPTTAVAAAVANPNKCPRGVKADGLTRLSGIISYI